MGGGVVFFFVGNRVGGVLVWSVMHLAAGDPSTPSVFLAGSVALAVRPRELFLRIFKK